MNRRRFVLLPFGALAAGGAARGVPGTPGAADVAYPAVVPGRALRFPDDEGSHPDFRIEWWYATGWLLDAAQRPLGFQITFFRNRPVATGGNPSRFAPTQLLVAHAAISDPQHGRLRHDQQLARGGFGLAGAAERMTDVHIGDWSLRAGGEAFHARMAGREFSLDLALRRTQPPLLHGDEGFSRKGPGAGSASYYYTLPHLAVTGSVVAGGKSTSVTGTAWLDHEWSTAPMEPQATGWDWIGINLDDGGALMAFRMRGAGGGALWSSATLRGADGRSRTFAPQQVTWTPVRQWRSARTGATYPVAWRVAIGELVLELEPLMDDQEMDARASTGTVYWEGAVTARARDRAIGRGYLELTGYWRPFRL
ncbi:MAG: carotenoid 1,2-hydratase [Betaproteobacteria bacterium]|nr:carotenoid 1,2-hydratase [Betaproteobacteria bacterium]